MKQKKGFTLVELVAVLAVVSVVIGVATLLFFMMFDFQQRYQEQSVQTATVNRLAKTFRDDMHTFGTPLFPTEDAVLLQWNDTGKTISYRITPGKFPGQKILLRDVTENKETIATEQFRLPDDTMIWFTEGKEQNQGLVAMNHWVHLRGTPIPDENLLDPFTRTLPKSLEQQIDPKFAGNWRTIIAKSSVYCAGEKIFVAASTAACYANDENCLKYQY